jgi:hypothetical protein
MDQITKLESKSFYRFSLFQGDTNSEDKIEKKKTLGMAYLKEGQNTYTLRLWTFIDTRFYLIQNRTDASKYLILTRELNKSPNAKTKYFWNIIGNGQADSVKGVLKLSFDLFERPIYMNLFPESSPGGNHLPDPSEFTVMH